MADQALIARLIEESKKRNKRLVDILTTFFQEASVLIFVFGILDTYSSGKLSRGVAVVVALSGFIFLIAAVSVQRAFDWLAIRKVNRMAKWIDDAQQGGMA